MIAISKTATVDYDVVIIGAGISGINFAHRLQERNPELSYCILEARHEIGGTWSLFQYPGIRSDSDLYTFGFSWSPWKQSNAIAEGSLISSYLKESAKEEGIEKNIRYNHRVSSMRWTTTSRTWTLDIDAGVPADGTESMTARFVLLGTGYYDYENPLEAPIPGIEDFKGTVVHPQFWPKNLDYQNKNVAIIGSGATAITMLPAMARKAAHVTMLQRSPGYVMSVSSQDRIEKLTKSVFPGIVASKLIRLKWILTSFLFVSFCKRFPKISRNMLRKESKRQLPEGYPLDPNFAPAYDPWQQRMCMCPDGDFYECLRSGKGSIITDTIDTVTSTNICLASGRELSPDIIVTATGLNLRIGGGIEIKVDGKIYNLADHFMWNGVMLEGLPNAVLAIGYVDASWTLGADATAQLACRLLKEMQEKKVSMLVPRIGAEEKEGIQELPFLALSSTYVERGKGHLPKVGDRPQWRPRSFYWKDLLMAWWGDIKTGLEWIS